MRITDIPEDDLLEMIYDTGDDDLMAAYIEGNYSVIEAFLNKNQNAIKKQNTVNTNGEIRKICNVCGHIFCYTKDDLAKNRSHQNWAKAHAVASLFGTSLDMYGQQSQMEKEQSQVVDYNRCPACHSTNLSNYYGNEHSNVEHANDASTVNYSSADEIKKYKELLDMGVITQEEFDAKKKQLLGL